MGISPVLQLSAEQIEELQHLSDIVHLFQHRNKNQHRRSVWWRHFSVFKKGLNSIASCVVQLRLVPESHVARTKKKAEDAIVQVRLEQSLELWRDVLVPKWQHAFSQLAADGRFAVLGLVLLSVLAESCRLLGITAAFEDLGQHEVEQVLERFGQEWQPTVPDEDASRAKTEDLGEVVVRGDTERSNKAENTSGGESDERVRLHAQPLTSKDIAKTAAMQRPASKIMTGIKKKKKTKKKGNAIDDLFDGFG